MRYILKGVVFLMLTSSAQTCETVPKDVIIWLFIITEKDRMNQQQAQQAGVESMPPAPLLIPQ